MNRFSEAWNESDLVEVPASFACLPGDEVETVLVPREEAEARPEFIELDDPTDD